MMLRLMASIGPSLPIGQRARSAPLALPVDTLKGAIRLSFAAYRLSLPFSAPSSNKNYDQKIA